MDLSMLSAIAAIVALPTTLLLWMMSKLHNDINGVSIRLDSHTASNDSKWISMSARIYTTQSVIISMLGKQGK